MLDHSGGKMAVPVIVDGGRITVGCGGESGVGFT